jgi:hypothetical protein
MLESGSSGSVRGVLSNEHPYREPRPKAELAPLIPARVRPMRCAKPFRASRDGSGSVRRHEANSLHRLFLPLKNMPTPLTPHA